MPFIHVKSFDAVMAKRAEHYYAADSKDDLLAQAVMRVAAVKKVGESSVPGRVFWQVRIQQINRHPKATVASNFISPRSKKNCSPLQGNLGPTRHFLQYIFYSPSLGRFSLPAT